MAQGNRHLVASKTAVRGDHRLCRGLADVVGPAQVETVTGKMNALHIWDKLSRFT